MSKSMDVKRSEHPRAKIPKGAVTDGITPDEKRVRAEALGAALRARMANSRQADEPVAE